MTASVVPSFQLCPRRRSSPPFPCRCVCLEATALTYFAESLVIPYARALPLTTASAHYVGPFIHGGVARLLLANANTLTDNDERNSADEERRAPWQALTVLSSVTVDCGNGSNFYLSSPPLACPDSGDSMFLSSACRAHAAKQKHSLPLVQPQTSQLGILPGGPKNLSLYRAGNLSRVRKEQVQPARHPLHSRAVRA